MINFKAERNEKSIKVEVSGHTGIMGNSLVCAAVSMLVISYLTVVESERTEDDKIFIEDGLAKINIQNNDKRAAYTDMLEAGIRWLHENHPGSINIEK